jgi:hypothetical protein
MNYWLMKSEPDAFSWDDLVAKGRAEWDGVRNHAAQLNMKAMKVGDRALFYHSNIGRQHRRQRQMDCGRGRAGRTAPAPRHTQGDEGRARAGRNGDDPPVAPFGLAGLGGGICANPRDGAGLTSMVCNT